MRTDGVHCRESAGTGPVNLKVVPNECCLWQVTMDQLLICASLSHTHYYWYEVGVLKVTITSKNDWAKGREFSEEIIKEEIDINTNQNKKKSVTPEKGNMVSANKAFRFFFKKRPDEDTEKSSRHYLWLANYGERTSTSTVWSFPSRWMEHATACCMACMRSRALIMFERWWDRTIIIIIIIDAHRRKVSISQRYHHNCYCILHFSSLVPP